MFKIKLILIISILVLFMFLYYNNKEKFGGSVTNPAITSLNTEAVTNISSVYNANDLRATNITASNKLSVNNGIAELGKISDTNDWDRMLIRSKFDANDKGSLFFNKWGSLGLWDDKVNWEIKKDGSSSLKGIQIVTPSDPHEMIEKKWVNSDNSVHKFGLGQWENGKLRAYAAGTWPGLDSSVNLSLTKADGSFDDKLVANKDGVQINGNLKIGSWNIFEKDGMLFFSKDGSKPTMRLRGLVELNSVSPDAIKIFNNKDRGSYWYYNNKGESGDSTCANDLPACRDK